MGRRGQRPMSDHTLQTLSPVIRGRCRNGLPTRGTKPRRGVALGRASRGFLLPSAFGVGSIPVASTRRGHSTECRISPFFVRIATRAAVRCMPGWSRWRRGYGAVDLLILHFGMRLLEILYSFVGCLRVVQVECGGASRR